LKGLGVMRLERSALVLGGLGLLLCAAFPALGEPAVKAADLGGLPKIAEVDPNFQSFNVEMVEVTGGRFGAPYASRTGERYAQRGPIDLKNSRLRMLASALASILSREFLRSIGPRCA